MRNVILNPTKQLAKKVNKQIAAHYRPRVKQALLVFTTNIGGHQVYKMSLDTFPALSTGSSMVMVSEIDPQKMTKPQYVFFLYEVYKAWPHLPMVMRGYTPTQVQWFRRKFGDRVFNEHTTVDWWRKLR